MKKMNCKSANLEESQFYKVRLTIVATKHEEFALEDASGKGGTSPSERRHKLPLVC